MGWTRRMSAAGAVPVQSASALMRHPSSRNTTMSKEHEVHKKAKKKPVLNPKERRLIKQAKKRARAVM
jgi:hypothetical protein